MVSRVETLYAVETLLSGHHLLLGCLEECNKVIGAHMTGCKKHEVPAALPSHEELARDGHWEEENLGCWVQASLPESGRKAHMKGSKGCILDWNCHQRKQQDQQLG